MKYVAISLYKKIILHAINEGMDRHLFNNFPTPLHAIDNLKAVPADHFFEAHEKLDTLLGPGFAIRVGQQMKIEDYGVLGLSWRTCSWAGEIFDRSERYFKLLSNTYLFKVDKGQEHSRVFLFRDAHRRGVELLNEATFSAAVVVLQAMTERTITPTSVSFKHRPPAKNDSHNAAFQCPVLFHQADNFIEYKTTDLETRTAKADKSINQFLVDCVLDETTGLEVSFNDLSSAVAQIIRDALPSGIPPLHRVARQVGMSSRTLTRRLAENNVTFRDLVHKSQEEISRTLLRTTSRSIAEVAFEAGFSEQSAFNRAFKRWTGLSPTMFRNT